MRLLIDTHIYLWWLTDDEKLTASAKQMIIDASEVYVSSASIWEAAIKISIGKLDANINDLVAEVPLNGFQELPITSAHAATVSGLPKHHNDPFDRLLIAQALTEPLFFMTADTKIPPYLPSLIKLV